MQYEIEQILGQTELPQSRYRQVSMLMLEEQLANQRIGGCRLLRLPPSAGFLQQLADAGLSYRVLMMVAVFSILYGLKIGGWGLIGQVAMIECLFADWILANGAGGTLHVWLVLALLGLAPAFVSQTANASAMAISLGGILLANRALSGIVGGLAALCRTVIAWQQVSGLFHAAKRQNRPRAFLTSAQIQAENRDRHVPLVTAHDLVYRYHAQGEPVLRGVNLAIGRGDRVLLQGASGGGKSTLASALAGTANGKRNSLTAAARSNRRRRVTS